MGDIFDPNGPGANLMNFGFSAMSAAAQPGIPTLSALGQGGLGMNQAAMQGAQTQGLRLQNQMGGLNLQRAQAMQPYFLKQAQNMGNGGGIGGGNGAGSSSDALFQQAYTAAMMSGDMKTAATVLQSWAEHNPELAGNIKGQQENNTLFKTADDTYVRGSQIGGGGGVTKPSNTGGQVWSPTAGRPPTSGQALPSPMVGGKPQAPENLDDLLNQESQNNGQPEATSGAVNQVPTSADGKPIIAGYKRLAPPDPSGAPAYKTINTATGVNQTKIFQESDNKANDSLNGSLSSLQNEQFRIKELGKIYQEVQAGTLTAQQPEFFNRMAALGFKDDPKSIADLGGVQAAMQNHVLQLVNQYKDTNNTMGEAPTRMFGGVINTLIEHGENPGNQPGGLHTVLGEALGAVNHHIDLIKGWNTIGGLGNRAAAGYTLRPNDYVRNWSLNHDMEDYNNMAQTEMKPFKGTSGNMGNNAKSPAASDIAFLKKNPNKSAHFDAEFGQGSSQQYLSAPTQGWR